MQFVFINFNLKLYIKLQSINLTYRREHSVIRLQIHRQAKGGRVNNQQPAHLALG